METYRELFEFAEGATLLRLLERKPDFPYDEEVVQVLSKRTDLPEAVELLNIFERKKDALREQNDVLSFKITVDRVVSDDNKEEYTLFFLEYFQMYSGWYMRRRYPLKEINEKMLEKSTLLPAVKFRCAIEETIPLSKSFNSIADYKPTPPTAAEARALLSGKVFGWSVLLIKFTFYYVDPSNFNKWHAYTKPYTKTDIACEFRNRNILRHSKYNKLYTAATDSAIISNWGDFVNKNNLLPTENLQLTFYMQNLLSNKLMGV